MSGTTRRPAARRLAGVLLFAVCLATALPASAATFDVVWTSPSGVAVAGNGLTKTAADGWNGEGAFASGTVVETYFIDFKTDAPSAATPELVCGLTRFGVSGLKPADIDFGLLLS